MILTLREWLRQNDLVLSHPGHGHGEPDSPVMFSTLERLDAKVRVITDEDD